MAAMEPKGRVLGVGPEEPGGLALGVVRFVRYFYIFVEVLHIMGRAVFGLSAGRVPLYSSPCMTRGPRLLWAVMRTPGPLSLLRRSCR